MQCVGTAGERWESARLGCVVCGEPGVAEGVWTPQPPGDAQEGSWQDVCKNKRQNWKQRRSRSRRGERAIPSSEDELHGYASEQPNLRNTVLGERNKAKP